MKRVKLTIRFEIYLDVNPEKNQEAKQFQQMGLSVTDMADILAAGLTPVCLPENLNQSSRDFLAAFTRVGSDRVAWKAEVWNNEPPAPLRGVQTDKIIAE